MSQVQRRLRIFLQVAFVATCLAAVAASAQTPATAVIVGSNLGDLAGNLVGSGSLCFQIADLSGNPMGVRGAGQITTRAACVPVLSGVVTPISGTFSVANTAATYPTPCYNVTLTDKTSGLPLYPPHGPYSCVQMNSSWCSTISTVYTCNWDLYPPSATPQVPVAAPSLISGTFSTGAPGSSVSCTVDTTGTFPTFALSCTIPKGDTGATGVAGPPGTGGATTPATSSLLKGTGIANGVTSAVAADVAALVQSATNCSLTGYVWQPATGTCVLAGAGGAVTGNPLQPVYLNNSSTATTYDPAAQSSPTLASTSGLNTRVYGAMPTSGFTGGSIFNGDSITLGTGATYIGIGAGNTGATVTGGHTFQNFAQLIAYKAGICTDLVNTSSCTGMQNWGHGGWSEIDIDRWEVFGGISAAQGGVYPASYPGDIPTLNDHILRVNEGTTNDLTQPRTYYPMLRDSLKAKLLWQLTPSSLKQMGSTMTATNWATEAAAPSGFPNPDALLFVGTGITATPGTHSPLVITLTSTEPGQTEWVLLRSYGTGSVTQNATFASGSTTLTLTAANSYVLVGQTVTAVSASGLAANTLVTNVSGTTITINNPTTLANTGGGAGQALNFAWPGNSTNAVVKYQYSDNPNTGGSSVTYDVPLYPNMPINTSTANTSDYVIPILIPLSSRLTGAHTITITPSTTNTTADKITVLAAGLLPAGLQHSTSPLAPNNSGQTVWTGGTPYQLNNYGDEAVARMDKEVVRKAVKEIQDAGGNAPYVNLRNYWRSTFGENANAGLPLALQHPSGADVTSLAAFDTVQSGHAEIARAFVYASGEIPFDTDPDNAHLNNTAVTTTPYVVSDNDEMITLLVSGTNPVVVLPAQGTSYAGSGKRKEFWIYNNSATLSATISAPSGSTSALGNAVGFTLNPSTFVGVTNPAQNVWVIDQIYPADSTQGTEKDNSTTPYTFGPTDNFVYNTAASATYNCAAPNANGKYLFFYNGAATAATLASCGTGANFAVPPQTGVVLANRNSANWYIVSTVGLIKAYNSCTTLALGQMCFDTAANNYHFYDGTQDVIFAGFSSASPPTTGHLAALTKTGNRWDYTDGGLPVLSGTSVALGTSAIAAGACASAVTSTVTGAASTMVAEVAPAVDPSTVTGYAAGGLTIQRWITTNTVNIKVCNATAASITPGALTVNVRVIQ